MRFLSAGMLVRTMSDTAGDMARAAVGKRLEEPDLRRLLDVGRALVAELDLESVLDKVLRTARELTDARYAAIGVLDDKKEQLARFLFVGIDEEQRRRIGPLPRGHGVLGELIRNPAPLRLHDVTAHPRSYGFPPQHPPMHSFLGVPIRVRDEVFGNLYLTDKEGGDFDERDEESVIVLADWAAIAIDNARLYDSLNSRHVELERAVRGLEATAVIARSVGAETDLERVLELVAKRGRALLDARSLVVVLARGGKTCVAAAAGEAREEVLGLELRRRRHGRGQRAQLRAPPSASPTWPAGWATASVTLAEGATSALVVPLAFRSQARGLLVAFDRLRAGRRSRPTTSTCSAPSRRARRSPSPPPSRSRTSAAARRSRRRSRSAAAGRASCTTRRFRSSARSRCSSRAPASRASRRRSSPAVDQAIDQIQLSISGLQGLITELRPAALDELGVGPALEALVKRVGATSGLDIKARGGPRLRAGTQPYAAPARHRERHLSDRPGGAHERDQARPGRARGDRGRGSTTSG